VPCSQNAPQLAPVYKKVLFRMKPYLKKDI
jgi:hypothetical protein